MVTNDIIKLNAIIKLDIDTKVIFEIILTSILNVNYLIKYTDSKVQSFLCQSASYFFPFNLLFLP